jgi:hypothetical protein
MAELADAADSKSAEGNLMGVRPPLPAPTLKPIGASAAESPFEFQGATMTATMFVLVWFALPVKKQH